MPAVVFGEMPLHEPDGVISAPALDVGGIRPDHGWDGGRDKDLLRQRFLRDALGYVHGAYVTPLAALHDVEVDETPVQVVAIEDVAASPYDVLEDVLLVSLDRRLPGDSPSGLHRGAVQRVEVGHRLDVQALDPGTPVPLPLLCAPGPPRLTALVRIQGGHPARPAMALRSRLQKGHEIGPNAGESDHARSVRPPARGAYSRPCGRWSRLPSSFCTAFGRAYSVWR